MLRGCVGDQNQGSQVRFLIQLNVSMKPLGARTKFLFEICAMALNFEGH